MDNQDYDSEAQEWADMLADNRIAELAEIDKPTLKDLLEAYDTGANDLELTGYSEMAVEALMTAYAPDNIGSELPDAEIAGEDTRNGYFLLLIKSPEDRRYWCDLLCQDIPTGNKTFTVTDIKEAVGE